MHHETPVQTLVGTQGFKIMDHSPITQTFEFGKSVSTAGKSILNLIHLSSLAAKYCKTGKYSPVKFANFLYFCITHGKLLPLCGNVVTPFSAKVYKICKLCITIFQHFTTFYNQISQFR